MSRAFTSSAMIAAAILVPAGAGAVPISGVGSLGSFTGTFDYDDETGTVEISLTNTSPGANGGFITAFLFNVPTGVDLTSALLTSSDEDFDEVLGGPDFDDGANGGPFGQFDIGGGLGSSFEGGGSPNGGIGVGGSVTFSFTLSGTGLSELTAADFLGTLSVPPAAGEGVEDFVVRFRGFEPEGSDKVPSDGPNGTSLPEPATALLLSLGVVSLWASRIGARRK